MEATFCEECETDLFSEQAVHCGGLVELIRAGYDGIARMNTTISNTAEYGEYVAGPRIVTDVTRAEMKRILADIQSGRFARDWVLENMAGQPSFNGMRAHAATHPIEEVGERLRAMMPWLAENHREKG